jgi:hypothetical protein
MSCGVIQELTEYRLPHFCSVAPGFRRSSDDIGVWLPLHPCFQKCLRQAVLVGQQVAARGSHTTDLPIPKMALACKANLDIELLYSVAGSHHQINCGYHDLSEKVLRFSGSAVKTMLKATKTRGTTAMRMELTE